MKIVQEDRNVLIIEDRPYLAGIGLTAFGLYWLWVATASFLEGNAGGVLPLAIFGAVMFALSTFVRLKVIAFDRTKGTLEILTRSLRANTRETHDLSDIEGVVLEERTASRSGSRSPGKVYRIAFILRREGESERPERLHPIQSYSGGGLRGAAGYRALVGRMQDWMTAN